MNSEPPVVRVEALGKTFRGYSRPLDRLRQWLQPMLRLFGAPPCRDFHEFRALHEVSLQVRRGETLGIIGRNGSGKSTLLQLICGTLHPSAGRVEVQGRVAALLELGAGFDPELSGRDNVYFSAGLYGLEHAQITDRLASIEAFAGIGDFIERPIKTYSSGMLVRLAFAVIVHVDADILVIDEALAVGDAYFSQKCMRFLRGFMQSGTLIFVSHDTGAIKALCDRVAWLDRGEIKLEGGAKDVCEAYLESEFPQARSIHPNLPGTGFDFAASEVRDQRDAFINRSNLRNDLRVFPFDPHVHGIGECGASIAHVGLFDDAGRQLSWVVGGETVCLRVRVRCHVRLSSPVIGFMVKDRVAQPLFGDNTYLSYLDTPVTARAGDWLQAEFSFDMPRLPLGDYAVIIAVADGDQEHNVQHHWIHDALRFRSVCSSVTGGMVGLPMRRIHLQCHLQEFAQSEPSVDENVAPADVGFDRA